MIIFAAEIDNNKEHTMATIVLQVPDSVDDMFNQILG